MKYLAKKHHRTGANNDAKIVAQRLDILLNVISHQHTMSRGEEEIFNVAELGPGQTFDLIAEVLRHAKATQAFACDVECYFPPNIVNQRGHSSIVLLLYNRHQADSQCWVWAVFVRARKI